MNYYITEDKTKMPIEEVMRLFKMTYWAAERPAETILKSMENSCCFAVIDEDTGKMLGFARAVTDYSTVYYLCDVVIDEACRGRGIGTTLINHINEYEPLKDIRGLLITKDAHGLYAKFGFVVLNNRAMAKGLVKLTPADEQKMAESAAAQPNFDD